MKAIDLVINSALPPELQADRRLDKKSVDGLLADVARLYPDRYSDIVQHISNAGRHAAYKQGETLTLKDMLPVVDKPGILKLMDKELAAVEASKLPEEGKAQARLGIWGRYADSMETQTRDAALASGNALGGAVISGARGNPSQLKAMLTSPALYTDYKDQVIPFFVRHGFNEGLRPAEYLASTFGVRKSVISTKSSTSDAGDLCLHEDTLVRMADLTTKRIQDIHCGDWVLGADKTGKTFPVEVTNVFFQGLRPVFTYSISLLGDPEFFETVTCSVWHKYLMLQPDSHTGANALQAIGLWQISSTGPFFDVRHKGKTLAFWGVKAAISSGLARCVDIEVDHPDHLFVLACGVICSNSKQLVQSATPTIVTTEDCGATNGLDFDVDSKDIEGRVLAKDYGSDFPAGTVVDKQVAQDLRRKLKGAKVIVRSPLTCQAPTGICASCLGTLPGGQFAPRGYAAGVTASHALTEPLVQNSLNSKHLGGIAKGKKQFAGFNIIDQLMQSPETFPYRAAVASEAGKVDKIEPAPQGGTFIFVNGKEHYALPTFESVVKVGDVVEAGDALSDGITDVRDVLRTRGLGEARRYYVDRLRQAMDESGVGRPSSLNLETVARGTLDHVVIDDPEGMGDYLPDDIGSYNKLSAAYQPPKDTLVTDIDKVAGQYLQQPALHYTIGTRLTPKMAAHLKGVGIKSVAVSPSEPKFTPTMFRLRSAGQQGNDWLAKMHTSYLTSNLAGSAARAEETNIQDNVHFAPRLMFGEGFGKKIETTGKF